jgi:hypothetical protein
MLSLYRDQQHPSDLSAPRRFLLAEQAKVEKMLKDTIGKSVIEESDSPWSSHDLLLRKKKGNIRFCVDYQLLNEVTEKDCFLLPRINNTQDTLARTKCFSTLYLKSAIGRLPCTRATRRRQCSLSDRGLTVINYALWTLQCSVNFQAANGIKPSRPCLWSFSVVHWWRDLCQLDIAGAAWPPAEDFQSHWGAHFKRNPEKCKLFQKEVWSRIVYHWESDHDKEKLKAVWECPLPRDEHDGSLLDLLIYYWKFIVGFTDLAKPLNYIAEGTLAFQWSSQTETAFWFLKSYIWHPC